MSGDIHLVLQGKGGVGKSLISSLLTQYLIEKSGGSIYCADTDPVNSTFAGYKSFGVSKVEILNDSKNIDQRTFDSLIEQLASLDIDAVVDNGASTFIPLSAYLLENGVIELLQSAGKRVIIHSVITGGQAMKDTIGGLHSVLKDQPTPVVVWQNEYFGDVQSDGMGFTDSAVYARYKDKIQGIVTLHRRNPDTFGKDMELMVSNKMTFDEAMVSDKFTLMPRQRLKTIQKSIYDQLAHCGL